MIKKISALILIFNLCFLPVFTQTLKKSEKDSRYSKVKLIVKSINIGNKKKREKPEPKKNYDRFEYDEAGRITKVISKDKGIIKISYDEYGRLKSKNESNIESQHYHYDKLGRNTKIEYRSKEKKDLVEFKYSTLEESYKLGYMNEKIEKNEHSFYKYKGRRLLEEKKVINGHTFIIKYRYNDKGLLSEIHYPSGLIVSYEYNDKNKIENVFVVRNKIRSEVLKYIKGKDSTTLQYGNGLNTEINIDKNKRTLNMRTGDIQNMEFRFNDKGLIEKVIDKKARRNKKEFYYDQYERLIAAYGPWGKISYRYDLMDNLTQKIEKDCKLKLSYDKKSSKIKELIKNDTNVIVKYDQLGRMTKYGSMTFSYNERGRLEKIIENGKPVIELFYNYKNQRVIEKRGNIIEYYYIYDNQDRVLAKYDNMGNILKQYIYSKETPVGFIKDNKICYYHYDLMNFPIMITDNTGKVVRKVQYKPYGEVISIKGELNDFLRFPGQYEIKGTNLSYNLNRTYFPELTRYLEPEPIVNVNNIYEYTSGNPIMSFDLKGLKEEWDKGGKRNCYDLRIKMKEAGLFVYTYIKVYGYYVQSCKCFEYDRNGTGKKELQKLVYGKFVASMHCVGINFNLKQVLGASESTFDTNGKSAQCRFAFPQVKEFIGDVDYGSITVTNPFSSSDTKSLTGFVIGNVIINMDDLMNYFRTQGWDAKLAIIGSCKTYDPGEYHCCK